MGHYAKVKNGIVENVIVATQDIAEAMPDSDDLMATLMVEQH